jgi:excisionase family DNA binding protein
MKSKSACEQWHCLEPLALDECRDVLTVIETGRVLRVGRTRAYSMVQSGEIPSFKAGNRRLVPREALRRWLDRAGAVDA